jgi:hypothetical protein
VTKDKVLSSHELKIQERVVIDIRYYDELNNLVRRQNNPVRIAVEIRNSIFHKTVTEDYMDEARFGQGTHTELETNGEPVSEQDIVYTTTIKMEALDTLTDLLIERLTHTTAKRLGLTIEGETKRIEIKASLLDFIMSHFEYISLWLPGLSSWVPLPQVHGVVKSLSIFSAHLLINKTILTCTESFILKNCILKSDPQANEQPSLLVSIGGSATLNDIKVANRVHLNINASNAADVNAWKDTQVTVSDVVIGFRDVEQNAKSYDGYYDALFTLAELGRVFVSGVSTLNDIPFYTLFQLKSIHQIDITDITRISKQLPAFAPALSLGNFTRANISGITYIGINESNPRSTFIALSAIRPDSVLSISNVELYMLFLMNLAGITCQKINIIDSSFIDSSVCAGMEDSTVGNFTVSNVQIKTASLSFKAVNLNILSSTSFEAAQTLRLASERTLHITSAKLKAQKIEVALQTETSFHVKDSSIDADETVKTYVMATENETNASRVSFIDSSVRAIDKVFDSINTLSFQNVIMWGSTLGISHCMGCTLGILIYGEKNVLYLILDDVVVRSSTVYLYEPGIEQIISIANGKGSLGIQYSDDLNLSSRGEIRLQDSLVVLDINAVSERKLSLRSDNSLGSQVIGRTALITLTPDLGSADRAFFERITDNRQRHMETVQYGILA